MPTARMMNVRAFFVRLNRFRTSKNLNLDKRNNLWLTEKQLVTGAEKFLKVNGYHRIDYNLTFNEGGYHFTSPIVGYRNAPQASLKRKHQQVRQKQQLVPEEKGHEVLQEHNNNNSNIATTTTTTTICILNPMIQNYDLGFFGHLESALYDVIDNYENTNLVLVTDSLSFLSIVLKEEINVTIENLMEERLYLLFLNDKMDYAFFEKYDDMVEKPITVYGD